MTDPWGQTARGNPAGEMVVTTTPTVEGRRISAYHGIVTGETILGANIFRDLFAGLR